jgi:hypothetical protein
MKKTAGILAGLVLSGCGDNHPVGVDGHRVEVIELCRQSVVVPHQLSSVAFCLNGNLYAFYSPNTGFSGFIHPGTYSGGSLAYPCQFTVSDSCRILGR